MPGEQSRDESASPKCARHGIQQQQQQHCIGAVEQHIDHVMRAGMSKLFRDEPDVRNLIKLKAIYEILEAVTDSCEDVANIIEGIIVENA